MNRRGFTIIELLVVIAIIGLLVAAATLAFTAARQSSRDATRIGDVLNYAKAIDQFSATNGGAYPGSTTVSYACNLTGSGGTAGLGLSSFRNGILPNDPQPVSATTGGGCPSKTLPPSMSNYSYGYIYDSEHGVTQQSSCSATTISSVAGCLGVTYAIEVGLENTKPVDDTTLQQPKSSPVVNTTAGIAGLPSNVETPPVPGRTWYVVEGSLCNNGSENNCYQ